MRVLDETCASDGTLRLANPQGLWALLVKLVRSRRNRVTVARLDAMSDHELYDIGLTRSDLHQVLSQSRFFDDPSTSLVRRTRRRGP